MRASYKFFARFFSGKKKNCRCLNFLLLLLQTMFLGIHFYTHTKKRAPDLMYLFPSRFFHIYIVISPQGSCSRIWQRDSYWNARPSSRRYIGWECNLMKLHCCILDCRTEYILFCAAMNIPFLFHAKITVLLVEKRGIKAQVILVLLQWNLRKGPTWIVLEVVASIILLHLHILLKHTRTCRKGFLFSRKAWHA